MPKLILTKRNIRSQHGLSMIEVLVSMILFAVGLLGIAAMQSVGVKITSNSNAMNTAVIQASNISDQMLASPQAIKDGIFDNVSNTIANVTCTNTCTPNELATASLYNWQQLLIEELPSGSGKIKRHANGLYTISISWKERGKGDNVKNEFVDKSHTLSFIPYLP